MKWFLFAAIAINVMACSSSSRDALNDGGRGDGALGTGDGSSLCIPDPALIAQKRQCFVDDDCPCGAHCELGQCHASCGNGVAACTGGQVCDRFGRCRAAANESLRGLSDVNPGKVVLDRPQVRLLDGAYAPVSVHAGPSAIDRLRFVASDPLELHCEPSGPAMAECLKTALPAGAGATVWVSLAKGKTLASTGLVQVYWGTSFASASVLPAASSPGLQAGLYTGTATLVETAVGARAAVPLATSMALPISAQIHLATDGGVIVLADRARALVRTGQWVGTLSKINSNGGEIRLPRIPFLTGTAATDFDVRATLTPATAALLFTPEKNAVSFTLDTKVDGLLADEQSPVLRWRFVLARTGDLTTLAAPAVPADAPLPAVAGITDSSWLQAVRKTLPLWTPDRITLDLAMPASELDDLLATAGEGLSATASARRRLDACLPGVPFPQKYWMDPTLACSAQPRARSCAQWTPQEFAGPLPAKHPLLPLTGSASLFSLVNDAVNAPVMLSNLATSPADFAGIEAGIPCEISVPAQTASCVDSKSRLATEIPLPAKVIDRCDELRKTHGCTPVLAGDKPVAFNLAFTRADGSASCSTAPTQTIAARVQRVCTYTPPTDAQCAELLLCANGTTPDAAGATSFALSSRVFSTSSGSGQLGAVSGDLACATPVAVPPSLALAADRQRDLSFTPKTSTVIAACVAELDKLLTPIPGGIDNQSGAGLLTLFWRDPSAVPQCLDAVRHLAAMELASKADANGVADARGSRLAHRLFQQWLQVHTLVASEAAQRNNVPDSVRGTKLLDDVPPPSESLTRSLRGWLLLLHPRFAAALAATPAEILDRPDYRAGFVKGPLENPSHQQPQGLPIAMAKLLQAELALLAGLLDTASLHQDTAILDGESASAGVTLRTLVAALPWINDLHARAVTGASLRGAAVPAWETAFTAAQSGLYAQLATVLGKIDGLVRGANPLGVEDTDLPLYYFSSTTDPASRFSAVSDYFLGSGPASGGWATVLLAEAKTAAQAVGTAYQTQAQRVYQAQLDDAAMADRVDAVRNQYGSQLANLCGMPTGMTATAFLETWEKRVGQPFDPALCHIVVEDATCMEAKAPPEASLDDVRFRLCVGRELNGANPGAVAFTDAGMARLVAAAKSKDEVMPDLSTCTKPSACSDGKQCMACGEVRAVFTSALLAPLDLLSGKDVDAARAKCRGIYPQAQDQLPRADVEVQTRCFRPASNQAQQAMTLNSALLSVAINRDAFSSMYEKYRVASQSCRMALATALQVQASEQAYVDEMNSFADAKEGVDIAAVACETAAKIAEIAADMTGADKALSIGSKVAYGIEIGAVVAGGALKSASIGLQASMDKLTRNHSLAIAKIQDSGEFTKCMNDASMELVGANGAALQIQSAIQDLQLAAYRLQAGVVSVKSLWDEGQAALANVKNATLKNRPPDLDAWVDGAVVNYTTTMHRARRFAYLAGRAVEYEFQFTTGVRANILTAETPGDLQSAIDSLLNITATNTVGGSRPSNLEAVLSLRQHLLQLQDRSSMSPSEQNLTDVERFRLMLTDPRHAVYDSKGLYQGQSIPFSLVPMQVGQLGDPKGIPILAAQDCAERVWSVNASVSGNAAKLIVGDQASFTRLDLLKANTFFSQWCGATGGSQSAYQTASVRPTVNLFQDPSFGTATSVGGNLGTGSGLESFTRARMQPRLNVQRQEFEKDGYASGQTSELAGRGLYGDYALFLPAGVLSRVQAAGGRSDGLNLDAVDDILLRFDYVSVAR